jgi:hypothetical protein
MSFFTTSLMTTSGPQVKRGEAYRILNDFDALAGRFVRPESMPE